MEFDARAVQRAHSLGTFPACYTTLTTLQRFDAAKRDIVPIAGCSAAVVILADVASPLKWARGTACCFRRTGVLGRRARMRIPFLRTLPD
jgi:hypothetical protein